MEDTKMVSNSLKKIAAGLAVVMVIGSFAGCSKGGNDQSGTGTGKNQKHQEA
jgi:hypothetical protein